MTTCALGFVEVGDDLGHEVVGDGAVVPVEVLDGRRGIVAAGEPLRGEDQAGRPPAGATQERIDARAGELELQHLEQVLGLLAGEREGVAADLGQLAGGAERPEGAERVVATRDHDPDVRRDPSGPAQEIRGDQVARDEVDVVDEDVAVNPLREDQPGIRMPARSASSASSWETLS